MDSEPVKLWRDKFRLNLSQSWKHDVEITVTDLVLWAKILDGWWYIDAKGKRRSKSPAIKGLLTEYERLQNLQSDNNGHSLSSRDRARLPEGRDSDMSQVWNTPPREYFRVNEMDAVRLSKVQERQRSNRYRSR